MHNKSFSVDNAVSIVGGPNIGEEYFELTGGAAFVDFDMLSFGPVLQEISEPFDDFWNHFRALPAQYIAKSNKNETLERLRVTIGMDLRVLYDDIHAGAVRNDLLQDIFTERCLLYAAPAKLIADSPRKLEEKVGPEHQLVPSELRKLFLGADQELLFVSPYYVRLDNAVRFACDAISRGIEVISVTNSLASSNQLLVHSGHSNYRRDVIRAGVQLYEARVDAGQSMTNPDAVHQLGYQAGLDGLPRLAVHLQFVCANPTR
jgi:putative cardiolipin synthase